MQARPKPAMLLPVAFAALLIAPVASASTPASTPAVSSGFTAAPTPAAAGEKVFVKLKIETGGKTLKHPGHKMETGEELVLVLDQGKKKHEAVVYVESTDSGYSVEVTYSTGGKQHLKATKAAKGEAWVTFESDDKKSKVSVKVNPGNKREDNVDVGGGDNPLDGL